MVIVRYSLLANSWTDTQVTIHWWRENTNIRTWVKELLGFWGSFTLTAFRNWCVSFHKWMDQVGLIDSPVLNHRTTCISQIFYKSTTGFAKIW